MDVFSLLKFWRNAGVGDSIDDDDDEGSFYDLVFSTHNDHPQVNIITTGFQQPLQCSNMDEDLKSNKSNHHTYYSSPHTNKLLPLESSNTNTKTNTNTNTKTTPRSPFRVLMLGLNNTKSKSVKMKCEMQEVVTISSLLKGDGGDQKNHMQSKRFSKDVVHRYLNDLIIKPLTARRSNQQEKPKPSVFKHFGKNRSSSSVVKPFPSPAAARMKVNDTEDGIQSAILHCKKSYNSPSQGSNVLSRSGSAPTQGTRISVDEEKRSSI